MMFIKKIKEEDIINSELNFKFTKIKYFLVKLFNKFYVRRR